MPADAVTSPKRIISINQFATENILRLGLQDKLIATAFPDDQFDPELLPLLEGIPQLSLRWPSTEQLLMKKPDFLYVGFPTGFEAGLIGTRSQWQQWGVSTLVSEAYCNPATRPLQWVDLWQDLALLATMFDRQPQLANLQTAARDSLPATAPARQWRVVHLDGIEQGARVSGGLGGVDLMIRLAGAQNQAASLPQRWGNWTLEQLLIANPEVISITDANFNDAERTKAYLLSHPVLSQIDAVRHHRFVKIPFTDTVASPRLLMGVKRLRAALDAFSKKNNQEVN